MVLYTLIFSILESSTKYYKGDQIKENEMGMTCSMNEMGNVYTILVGRTKGKRPLGRPKHRWKDKSEGS
jgi:hypothetical protein